MLSKIRSASGLLDQIFSSASNGLILFALAVVAAPNDFGRIALLFTLLAATIGVLRGALGTPLLLAAGSGNASVLRHGGYSVAAAGVAGVAVSVALIATGALLGTLNESLLMAATVPVVLMQDTLRYTAIGLGRPHLAAMWDGLWFVGSAAFWIIAWLNPAGLSPNGLVFGWCALAVIALIGLAFTLGTGPRVRGLWKWFSDDPWHRVRYGVDSGLEQVSVFLVLGLAGLYVGENASAALRGSAAALAPLAIIGSALPLLVIPETARNGRPPTETWRVLMKVAALTSSIALLSGVLIRVLPQSWGRLILGDTFELSRHIVLLIAGEYTVAAWLFVIGVYLKSQNRSTEALLTKSVFVATTLLVTACALAVDRSALSVALGMLIASTLVTLGALSWFVPWREPRTQGPLEPSHRTLGQSSLDEHRLKGNTHVPVEEAHRGGSLVAAGVPCQESHAAIVWPPDLGDSQHHADHRYRRQTCDAWRGN